jgi:hypothetical protein
MGQFKMGTNLKTRLVVSLCNPDNTEGVKCENSTDKIDLFLNHYKFKLNQYHGSLDWSKRGEEVPIIYKWIPKREF